MDQQSIERAYQHERQMAHDARFFSLFQTALKLLHGPHLDAPTLGKMARDWAIQALEFGRAPDMAGQQQPIGLPHSAAPTTVQLPAQSTGGDLFGALFSGWNTALLRDILMAVVELVLARAHGGTPEQVDAARKAVDAKIETLVEWRLAQPKRQPAAG